ncbi:MAG: hypothetical protein A2X86_02580 [Bdellovibrionales bacterium GWA2_49_15]|nr:MAG: hypothetical protein A2X86_02580 [Bdellovibrionales bacterium GWA2_49_15]HAZ14176.1 hypothetical protein [Bdellovibrionales bacterium]
MPFRGAFIFWWLILAPSAWAADCREFQTGASWLLPKELRESSGVAYDGEQGGLYQINDSGNDAVIWKTDLSGNKLQKISLEGVKNIDFEDVSIGGCPGRGHGEEKCFFLADIGDNRQSRRDEEIHVIHIFDLKSLGTSSSLKPMSSFSLLYPDRIHNSESFAVHPRFPYAYLLTKDYEGMLFKNVIPAKLFRIDLSAVTSGNPITLIEVGALNIEMLAGSRKALPTSMEFSPDGEWLYILTYKNVVAIKNTGWANTRAPFPTVWEQGKNYFVMQIDEQKQMEALTFISNDQFMVTSEGRNMKAIIYNCRPKALPRQ